MYVYVKFKESREVGRLSGCRVVDDPEVTAVKIGRIGEDVDWEALGGLEPIDPKDLSKRIKLPMRDVYGISARREWHGHDEEQDEWLVESDARDIDEFERWMRENVQYVLANDEYVWSRTDVLSPTNWRDEPDLEDDVEGEDTVPQDEGEFADLEEPDELFEETQPPAGEAQIELDEPDENDSGIAADADEAEPPVTADTDGDEVYDEAVGVAAVDHDAAPDVASEQPAAEESDEEQGVVEPSMPTETVPERPVNPSADDWFRGDATAAEASEDPSETEPATAPTAHVPAGDEDASPDQPLPRPDARRERVCALMAEVNGESSYEANLTRYDVEGEDKVMPAPGTLAKAVAAALVEDGPAVRNVADALAALDGPVQRCHMTNKLAVTVADLMAESSLTGEMPFGLISSLDELTESLSGLDVPDARAAEGNLSEIARTLETLPDAVAPRTIAMSIADAALYADAEDAALAALRALLDYAQVPDDIQGPAAMVKFAYMVEVNIR